MFQITRTAVADIRDYCALQPREVLYVQQDNYQGLQETCFYAWLQRPKDSRSTVAVWIIKPKEVRNAD